MRFLPSLCLAVLIAALGGPASPAQEPNLLPLQNGVAVVTCYSGYIDADGDAIVDRDGYVMGVIDVRNPPANVLGRNWSPPMYHHPSWTARNLGQIFGTAIDHDRNIYVSSFGLYKYEPQRTLWGAAGAGGVYRIDGSTGAITTLASLMNYGSGLGDLCFDEIHGQLFVTNLEDGRIYRLGLDGTQLQVFDPMRADNGARGIAPVGELLWGIGAFDGRLYYSVWNERGTFFGDEPNTIRSVALDASGAILPNTDREEFEIPLYQQRPDEVFSPISDIAFHPDGYMLLAERPIYGEFGSTAYFGASEFYGRVHRYRLGAARWTPDREIYVGNAGTNTNSQGGIDVTCTEPGECDGRIWVTANPLIGEDVANAGLAGIPWSGNSQANVDRTSVYIDADGALTASEHIKSLMGDIEMPRPIPPPDSLSTCPEITATLDAGDGTAWRWAPSTGLSCTDCRIPEVSANTETTYRVVGIDRNGNRFVRTFRVIPGDGERIAAHAGVYGPIGFKDTLEVEVFLDENVAAFGVRTLEGGLLYDDRVMRPVLDNTGRPVLRTDGGPLDGWLVTASTAGPGDVRFAFASNGADLAGSGRILRVPFETFYSMDTGTRPDTLEVVTLPLELNIAATRMSCTQVVATPGSVALQTCGLGYRLIEMIAGKYSFGVAPNVIRDAAMLRLSIPFDERVTIEIFDAAGIPVAVPLDERLRAGGYEMQLDASLLSSGVYVCRITSGEWSRTEPIVVAR